MRAHVFFKVFSFKKNHKSRSSQRFGLIAMLWVGKNYPERKKNSYDASILKNSKKI
jgi:hypothetical protein